MICFCLARCGNMATFRNICEKNKKKSQLSKTKIKRFADFTVGGVEQHCTSNRSRRESSDEHLVAQAGVNTSENEPLIVRLMLELITGFLIFTDPPCSYAEDGCRGTQEEIRKSVATEVRLLLQPAEDS